MSCVLRSFMSLLIAVSVSSIGIHGAIAADTGLKTYGRWFSYNGRFPYFVGYDMQELFAKKSYSYSDIEYKLNQLKEFRINKVRVWVNPWFAGAGAYYPWAVDASGKKNLDVWDGTYWTRMRDFVKKCKDRDIIVEVTIFSPYPKDIKADGWWRNTNWKIAWNKKFNTNDAFSANERGNFFPQFFDLAYGEKSSSGKTLRDYQRALIDKTIDELKGYGNVYFELANEFPGVRNNGNAINRVYAWQQYWARYVHEAKGAITSCHANELSALNDWGIQRFKDESYVDILTFHFYSADPINEVPRFLHGLQTAGKVIQSNESHVYLMSADSMDRCTREAWTAFTSGAYYFHYQRGVDTDSIGTSLWRRGAERLETLRNVAESVEFWKMSPVDRRGNEYDSLVIDCPGLNWQVLANPANEYVVYFVAASMKFTERILSVIKWFVWPVDIHMRLPSGSYRYKYYDTRNWNSDGIKGGTVNSSGGFTSIPVPSLSTWSRGTGFVLVIRAKSSNGKT
jgi:hypothetical protein